MTARPFIPVHNTIRGEVVSLPGAFASGEVITPAFFCPNSPALQADVDAVADFLKAWWTAQVKPIVPNNMAFDFTRATDMAIEFGVQQTRVLAAFGEDNPGLSAVETQLSLLHSAQRGRSFEGRLYFFSASSAHYDVGKWQDTYTAEVAFALNILKEDAASAGYPLSVASKKLGASSIVQTITTPNKYSYQTRRDPHRGS